MSISDDGTQDLLGPAKRDEGIRVHTIHKFAVAHVWSSVGLGTFEDLFSYFGGVHFVVFIAFVDLLVYECDNIFEFYLHILLCDLGVLVKSLNSVLGVWGEWFFIGVIEWYIPYFETHGDDRAEAGDGPQLPHGRLCLTDFLDNSVAGVLGSLPEHHLLICPVLRVVKAGDVWEACQEIYVDGFGWYFITSEWFDDGWGHVGEGVDGSNFFEMSSDGDV